MCLIDSLGACGLLNSSFITLYYRICSLFDVFLPKQNKDMFVYTP